MDWRDALGGLLAEGNLPPGDDTPADTADAPVKSVQREPLHVLMERKGRGGKTATIVEGFLCDDNELQRVARTLKQKLGTGGSARGGEILIQGDVVAKVRDLLRSMGYKVKG
ncbi:MAG: translation initiation factor [Bacteroidales bacterium]|nr:translation initiation factor [Bacteroidales bacterium]